MSTNLITHVLNISSKEKNDDDDAKKNLFFLAFRFYKPSCYCCTESTKKNSVIK